MTVRKIDVKKGDRYGRLTIIKEVERLNDKRKRRQFLCICDCGNEKIVRLESLRIGCTRSCGCLNSELTVKRHITHGKYHSRLHYIWASMKQRCLNPNNKSYKNYGGRGIEIFKDWQEDFMNFYKWAMSHGYKDSLTIDREDVNGNYEPGNCRWVSMKTQANNRRNNHFIELNGQTKTASQWAEELGINPKKLFSRIKKMGDQEALKYTIRELRGQYDKNSCKRE